MAYRLLKDGETGPDAAKASITVMNDRIKRLTEWVQCLRRRQTAGGEGSAKAKPGRQEENGQEGR